jgi:hypothetical protein
MVGPVGNVASVFTNAKIDPLGKRAPALISATIVGPGLLMFMM